MNVKKIVLLTGSELRHEFFRKYIANDNKINVLATFCESEKGNLQEIIKKEKGNSLRINHLEARSQTEIDFFGIYCEAIEDKSNPFFIEKGEINDVDKVEKIVELAPDIIISYGCSIIRSDLLEVFKGRFINIHLGLAPYYRGAGTNFWPFVNNELACIGSTFMHIDAGIDTGMIIHQVRAKISFHDNIHQIGNRLIKDSFVECKKLIKCFDKLGKMEKMLSDNESGRYYRNKDFTESSLEKAYINMRNNSVAQYLDNIEQMESQYPIIKNPSII